MLCRGALNVAPIMRVARFMNMRRHERTIQDLGCRRELAVDQLLDPGRAAAQNVCWCTLAIVVPFARNRQHMYAERLRETALRPSVSILLNMIALSARLVLESSWRSDFFAL